MPIAETMTKKIIPNKIELDENGNPFGIVVINKPAGITSHDVVYKLRKALATKKIGHAGTLDPFAEGVLILGVGRYTKLLSNYLNHNKKYEFELVVGVETKTLDTESEVIDVKNVQSTITIEQVDKIFRTFKKQYSQIVPVFSSVKVNGEKLRVLARKYDTFEIDETSSPPVASFYKDSKIAKQVDLPVREITIENYNILNLEKVKSSSKLITSKLQINSEDEVDLFLVRAEVECSKGTYIRQLGKDIANNLANVPGTLISLKRLKSGSFAIEDAISIEEITKLSKS